MLPVIGYRARDPFCGRSLVRDQSLNRVEISRGSNPAVWSALSSLGLFHRGTTTNAEVWSSRKDTLVLNHGGTRRASSTTTALSVWTIRLTALSARVSRSGSKQASWVRS